MSDIGITGTGTWVALAWALSVAVSVLVLWLWRQSRNANVGARVVQPPPPDDPRWSEEGPPQIVGARCVVCSRVVRTEGEAVACNVCGRVCHLACLAQHQGSAHAATNGPFRGTGER
jgi:hypothetical protein